MKSPNRREFIINGLGTTMGMFFCTHLFAQLQSPNEIVSKAPLLSEIQLLVREEITAMVHFYHEILGLPLLKQTRQLCSFRAGASILTFKFSPEEKDGPFYHFAFNIPENKIQYAEEWQLKRSSLIKPPARLTDAGASKNIVHFRHWNAHSIFFFDPAGNVVEYIARHTLSNYAKGDFSIKDILYISEIGLVVDDVAEAYQTISTQFGLGQYSTSSSQFLAMGDEYGLLLLMGIGTKAAFQKGRDRKVYGTEVTLNLLTQNSALKLANYPYHLKL